MDEENFLDQYEEVFRDFISSDQQQLEMEPMNSYFRKLLHDLGTEFKFETTSNGEGPERHILVRKTEESKAPEKTLRKKRQTWSFGDREFFVDSTSNSVEVYLDRNGNVGFYDKRSDPKHIARKKVTTGSFKIKENKIIEIIDSEW